MSNLLYERANDLLTAAKAALGTRAPGRAFVTIGQPAWDTSDEDCVEQLTVNMLGLRFTQDKTVNTAAVLAPVYSIVLLRCVTALGSEGQIPDAGTLDNEAARLYRDAGDLVNEITKRWTDSLLFPGVAADKVSFADLAPQGPSGGLAGWRWDIELSPLQ